MIRSLISVCLASALLLAHGEAVAGPFSKGGKSALSKRMSGAVRRASIRVARTMRTIHERTPPALRHGVAAVGLATIAAVSIDSLVGAPMMTWKQGAAAVGAALTTAGSLGQTFKTVKAAFPRQTERARKRLERSPVGPLVKKPSFLSRLSGYLGISRSYRANRARDQAQQRRAARPSDQQDQQE